MKKVLLVLTVLFAFSCTTTIGALKQSPEKYVGEVVAVKGEVTKVVSIPFSDYSFFELADKTDNIVVFTLNERNKGEMLTIKAEVIGYDSSDQEKSTKLIVDKVETFFLNNIKADEDKVKKNAETVGKFISSILKKMKATYFLIEQE